MNRAAIYHRPMSEYCHGLDEGHIVYRLRCAKGDLERVTLSYGDTACRVTPIIFTTLEMEKAASDEFHDYWEVTAESKYSRVYYYFTLYAQDGEWTHYYGGELTRTLVDERSEYFKLPYNHRADIARVPDWARDALVYNIFPDSFASADGFVPGTGAELDHGGETSRSRLGGTLDGVAATAIRSIGDMTGPLAMMIIGASLAEQNARELLDLDVLLVSLMRLVVMPLIALAALRLAGVDETLVQVTVILLAMPVAYTTAILAERYNANYHFASKCVCLSTLLSLVTVPLMCLVL